MLAGVPGKRLPLMLRNVRNRSTQNCRFCRLSAAVWQQRHSEAPVHLGYFRVGAEPRYVAAHLGRPEPGLDNFRARLMQADGSVSRRRSVQWEGRMNRPNPGVAPHMGKGQIDSCAGDSPT